MEPGPKVDGRAGRIAALAAAGLVAGLSACSPAPQQEVVVDPAAVQNTGSGDPAAVPAASAAATAETVDPEQLAPKRGPRTVTAVAARQGRDCCKGMNDCKGLGGCRTDEHACMGMNDCKGLGGCKTGQCDASAAPAGGKDCCKGKNQCMGLGGCKTDRHDCKGKNDCKGQGGCKTC